MLKPRSGVVFAVVAALAVLAVPPASAGSIQSDDRVSSYIVSLRSGDPGQIAAEQGRRRGTQIRHVYRHAMRGYAASMSVAAADQLAQDDRVAAVIPDGTVSIAAQTLPTGIDRADGELSSAVSGNGSGSVDVDIAIIDTGIDTTHPDLNVVGGTNCSSGTSYNDGNGHGSHVAGIAAAKDNAIGIVGIAPGARLWAVRVLNDAGTGTFSSVICGIDWVTAHSSVIDVANMSLGGSGSDGSCASQPLHQAICNSVNAGVTYVVAAGNSASDAQYFAPATYSQVITVSALADFNGQPGGGARATCLNDVDDTFADFSNFGSDIDLIAPGTCIRSTWKGGRYKTVSGTSMASPHVAGAAALYASTHPWATPSQVKAALQTAGNLDWNDSDDPDAAEEKLLNVDAF